MAANLLAINSRFEVILGDDAEKRLGFVFRVYRGANLFYLLGAVYAIHSNVALHWM